ncbi:DUF2141 domain-containing protein [Costertonia aggregata]|uniref:DUF2141 domain-containing protein n=1 Tax=Costertonia aggregata TaxID=343403 RepID=A0A7H9AL10_9FLAO|nr:DUF2141 domain-containing protein [Costertonia aggregata]QLG44024.1 DUF2141 domain-containing protein [Costertonia aggregata]
MKTLGLILGLVFTGMIATAQDAEGITVTLTIENVLNENGNVMASLHTADTFMKGAGVTDLEKAAKKGEMTFTFENVVPGTYAIMILHDENENKRMDFEANGMPKENYSMSGNDMTMGPPTFEGTKFEVTDADKSISVRF